MKVSIEIEDLKAMCDEIVHLRQQRDHLQRANNDEVQRRRDAETNYRRIIEEMSMLNTLQDVFDLYGVSSFAGLEKAFYRHTSCGAWIKQDESDVEVILEMGSIVEGSDAEVGPFRIMLPISRANWKDTVKHIEERADELWREANGDDTGCADDS